MVSIRDTGIGIPANALATIFEMFAQVDRSWEKPQGGLGIGLTLVKRLVELHGGSVEARSEGVNKGSEFRARLPVAVVSRPSQSERRHTTSSADALGWRILVADDNRDAAESMSMMLRLMGNEVRTVNDGLQAIVEAAEVRPDVILLDIGMPNLNGYDVARSIRQQRWGSEPLLVALTGWGQAEDRERAFKAGFDEHFTKPVQPDVIEHLLTQLRGSPR